MPKTTAEYHDGVSSSVKQVELSFNDDGSIYIHGEGVSRIYLLEELSFSPRLGNIPRVITFPEKATCHVHDNDLIDVFLKQHNQGAGSSIIHLLESRLVYVIAAVLFTVIFSWFMVVDGVPHFAKQIALNLPLGVDRALGQGTLDTLDKIVFSESTACAEDQQRLRQRFQTMKQSLEGADGYELIFRHGNKIGANAFALPSGIVVVTDELIDLSENDDEVIAVLAHEIGHLVYRHSVRMVLQNSAVAVLVTTITGDPFSTSSLVVALPTLLANSNYSREFELEADDYAYQYLIDNNIELVNFANILERITDGEPDSDIVTYLSSHPKTEQRLRRFK